MKKIVAFSLMVCALTSSFAQQVILTFTGRDANNQYHRMDSVVINNITQGWNEVLLWPDTTLIMQNVIGIDDYAFSCDFGLSNNNPNPFNGSTSVKLNLPGAGTVTMTITDVNGRIVETMHTPSLQCGTHQFRIEVAVPGLYFLTARQSGKTSTIKMVNNGGTHNSIEYAGTTFTPKSNSRGTTTNPFVPGDQMEYVGYATFYDEGLESEHILQTQDSSQAFILQFDEVEEQIEGVPCLGTPTVTDIDGNVYQTVWIGTQCWMRENLRTTKFPNGTPIPHTPFADFYELNWSYPNDDSTLVGTYGLLYNWFAVMNRERQTYANPSGVQGVCPDGWHVPSVTEFVQMKRAVSIQTINYAEEIASYLCGNTGWISSDVPYAAGNLSSPSRNLSGFSALPAGWRTGNANGFGRNAVFWSTSEFEGDGYAYTLSMYYNNTWTHTHDFSTLDYCSVRCLRNEDFPQHPVAIPCAGAETVTDADGNEYATVKIGEQCWMRENLRVTKYADGRPIAHGNGGSSSVAYWYYPNNDTAGIATYGLYYNWLALMDTASASNDNPSGVQGVCPTGWHLPSEAEWIQLSDYVVGQPENRCSGQCENTAKALASAEGWLESEDGCTVGNAPTGNNLTGFSAYPTGEFGGNYYGFGCGAYFWCTSDVGEDTARILYFRYDFEEETLCNSEKDSGHSVRCLRD